MVDNNFIEFPCLQVNQPIGTFYIGVMDFNNVINISYADVRRMERREVEVYLGIQRELSEKRLKEIRSYVRTVDATFPTSVILAVDEVAEDGTPNAVYDDKTRVMRIRKDHRVAKIIDGQHRIAGLINYEGIPFQLNVTMFIDMDIEDQALVFATINISQTKVSKSLVYDLYDYAVARSPQKSCHNIAKLMNAQERSPFHGRIKILGRATGKMHENLTQATFVERLMPYISREPMKDRDEIKRGRKVARATRVDEENGQLVFRNMFLDDRDEDIAMVIWAFFSAVSNRWHTAWNTDETGFILNRSTGFAALMRFLPKAYLNVARPGTVPKQAEFAKLLERINLGDANFTKEQFVPGSSGERALLDTLLKQAGFRT